MASDKVVQNAVQTLNAELGHIRKVLERIAVALERQVEQIASLTPSPYSSASHPAMGKFGQQAT
jgi:hypothetical protein